VEEADVVTKFSYNLDRGTQRLAVGPRAGKGSEIHDAGASFQVAMSIKRTRSTLQKCAC
jgi:hypothetical protein